MRPDSGPSRAGSVNALGLQKIRTKNKLDEHDERFIDDLLDRKSASSIAQEEEHLEGGEKEKQKQKQPDPQDAGDVTDDSEQFRTSFYNIQGTQHVNESETDGEGVDCNCDCNCSQYCSAEKFEACCTRLDPRRINWSACRASCWSCIKTKARDSKSLLVTNGGSEKEISPKIRQQAKRNI